MATIILTAPPQAWQVSMSMLNTRLSRCAQVIDARRSAGVGSYESGGARRFPPLPPLGGCHSRTGLAVRRKDPMKPHEVDFGLRHQRGESDNEVERLKDNVRGAITIGRFQLKAHLTVLSQRQALLGYGRPGVDANRFPTAAKIEESSNPAPRIRNALISAALWFFAR